jgi:hypothetical protein
MLLAFHIYIVSCGGLIDLWLVAWFQTSRIMGGLTCLVSRSTGLKVPSAFGLCMLVYFIFIIMLSPYLFLLLFILDNRS